MKVSSVGGRGKGKGVEKANDEMKRRSHFHKNGKRKKKGRTHIGWISSFLFIFASLSRLRKTGLDRTEEREIARRKRRNTVVVFPKAKLLAASEMILTLVADNWHRRP